MPTEVYYYAPSLSEIAWDVYRVREYPEGRGERNMAGRHLRQQSAIDHVMRLREARDNPAPLNTDDESGA